jgi:hypothetical protein
MLQRTTDSRNPSILVVFFFCLNLSIQRRTQCSTWCIVLELLIDACVLLFRQKKISVQPVGLISQELICWKLYEVEKYLVIYRAINWLERVVGKSINISAEFNWCIRSSRKSFIDEEDTKKELQCMPTDLHSRKGLTFSTRTTFSFKNIPFLMLVNYYHHLGQVYVIKLYIST